MSYVTLAMNPAQSANNMRREIERLLHDSVPVRTSPAWQPAGSAYEDATGFTMQFDVPGVAPHQLEVTAQDGSLVISGTRDVQESVKDAHTIFAERPSGSFERRLRLPKTADLASVVASYANGVLSIRVEKLAAVAPRKVAIEIAEPAMQAPTTK